MKLIYLRSLFTCFFILYNRLSIFCSFRYSLCCLRYISANTKGMKQVKGCMCKDTLAVQEDSGMPCLQSVRSLTVPVLGLRLLHAENAASLLVCCYRNFTVCRSSRVSNACRLPWWCTPCDGGALSLVLCCVAKWSEEETSSGVDIFMHMQEKDCTDKTCNVWGWPSRPRRNNNRTFTASTTKQQEQRD